MPYLFNDDKSKVDFETAFDGRLADTMYENIVAETTTSTSKEVNAGSSAYINVNISKSGWRCIGVVGSICTNDAISISSIGLYSGTSIKAYMRDSANVRVYLYNPTSSSATTQVHVSTLWIKEG